MDYLWYGLCMCVVREVQATCGGHGGYGVCVNYLWVVYVL